MLIKNAGTLSQNYFNAYFQLILNTKNCTMEEAKDIAWENLFVGDKNTLGNTSYQNFIAAYQEQKQRKDSP